jgi:hypothetical protein
MEEMNKKMDSTHCTCGNSWAQRHMHRLLLAIFIVTLAFWVGMKLGEIKGFIMADMMNSGGYRGGMMIHKMDSRDIRMMPAEVSTEAAPQQ